MWKTGLNVGDNLNLYDLFYLKSDINISSEGSKY